MYCTRAPTRRVATGAVRIDECRPRGDRESRIRTGRRHWPAAATRHYHHGRDEKSHQQPQSRHTPGRESKGSKCFILRDLNDLLQFFSDPRSSLGLLCLALPKVSAFRLTLNDLEQCDHLAKVLSLAAARTPCPC